MENKYDIYICYSRKDIDYAHAITRIIESMGYSYFFDYNGIYSGDDFAMRINDAIFKFKRYEDASLTYTCIDKHINDEVGGWDTTIRKTQYEKLFYNQKLISN